MSVYREPSPPSTIGDATFEPPEAPIVAGPDVDDAEVYEVEAESRGDDDADVEHPARALAYGVMIVLMIAIFLFGFDPTAAR